MGKVEAWECVHCGSLFRGQNAMVNHRRKCAKEAKIRKAKEEERQKAIELANSFRLELEDINEIPNIITNIVSGLGRSMTISKWELRFSEILAPTHDAPIGKKTNFYNEDKTYYKGWNGRVEGITDLYRKPIKHDGGAFGKISGISDICRVFIKGVHTGSGGGGDKFGYGIRIYLDDFPKIKKQYDEWKIEDDKRIIYYEKSRELVNSVRKEMIDNNERIKTLKAIGIILRARLNQVDEEQKKIGQDVLNSQEYLDAIKVPNEYQYNNEIYYGMKNIFS